MRDFLRIHKIQNPLIILGPELIRMRVFLSVYKILVFGLMFEGLIRSILPRVTTCSSD